jgi:uncharacterized protein YxjI
MKYLVPRLRPAPDEPLWITSDDGARLMQIETAAHGRASELILQDADGDALAVVRIRRRLGGPVAEVEIEGRTFARLGRPRKGAVAVRAEAGDYDIAGDFADWDFSVLLNTSPVADVAPRRTGEATYLVETSDHEDQAPLLAMVLAVDLLVQAAR